MKKLPLILFLFYVCAYLLPLGGRPLVMPDEMRYGEMAREMIATNDWVVPRLMEFRYFEKPILGHWLNAASMWLFGENHFGIRFASAFTAGLAALGVYLLVRRVRDKETAGLAALIQLSFAEAHIIGTYSSLDTMVAAFITLGLCCFYPALTAERKQQYRWLALVGFFTGCAFLVKGFLAIAIPVMVIAGFLLVQKRWADLLRMPWIPLLVILAVSLPWSIMIALRESDYWHYFFFEEHIHRFFSKGEAEHSEPFWYFIPVLLIGALPWTILAPIPLMNTVKKKRSDPLVRFCLLWFALPFLFFSASSGKLGTYIIPCFPPLAILLTIGMSPISETVTKKYFRVGSWIFFGILLLGTIGLGITAILPIDSVKLYKPWEMYKYGIFLSGLTVATAAAFMALRHKTLSMRPLFIGMAVLMGLSTFQFCLPESRSVTVSMDRFMREQKQHIPADALMITDSRGFTGVGMMLGRADAYIHGRMGELDYGIAYPDAAHRYLGGSVKDLLSFFEQHSNQPIAVMMRRDVIDSALAQLPKPDHHAEFRYMRCYVFLPQTNEDTTHAN